MADSKILSGPRGQVWLNGTQIAVVSCNFTVGYDSQDVYICGATGPQAIEYTGVEPVSGSLTMWRFVGLGAHLVARMPTVDKLLTSDYLVITLTDRVTGVAVGTITGVRLLGMGTGITDRQLSQMNIPFKGLKHGDENFSNDEAAGATQLPVIPEN